MDINQQLIAAGEADRALKAQIAADTTPAIGPAACHACHLPGLYWFRTRGWLQRDLIGEVMGVRQYAFVEHRCTARDIPDALRVASFLREVRRGTA